MVSKQSALQRVLRNKDEFSENYSTYLEVNGREGELFYCFEVSTQDIVET